MSDARRATGWRIGVAALNLLAPGLGLLRVGRVRHGWLMIAGSLAALPASALVVAGGTPGPRLFIAVFGLLLLTLLALYGVTIVATWRASAIRTAPRSIWSRWYGVLLAGVLVAAVSNLTGGMMESFYRSYYTPTASMAPTFAVNDQVFANMRGGRTPRIGDIVLVRSPGGDTRIARVAALGGDRIALRSGVPIRNGVAAVQRADGTVTVANAAPEPSERARRLIERLPGETGTHHVLDLDVAPGDDFAEIRVPSGHLFLLGDNRDRTADSRFAATQNGLGMLPLAAVLGEPIAYSWNTGARFATKPR